MGKDGSAGTPTGGSQKGVKKSSWQLLTKLTTHAPASSQFLELYTRKWRHIYKNVYSSSVHNNSTLEENLQIFMESGEIILYKYDKYGKWSWLNTIQQYKRMFYGSVKQCG